MGKERTEPLLFSAIEPEYHPAGTTATQSRFDCELRNVTPDYALETP